MNEVQYESFVKDGIRLEMSNPLPSFPTPDPILREKARQEIAEEERVVKIIEGILREHGIEMNIYGNYVGDPEVSLWHDGELVAGIEHSIEMREP